MNPPKHLIDAMLADGYFGELVSILCLGAAIVIKKGLPPEAASIRDADGDSLPPGMEAALLGAHAKSVAELRKATPEELDHAIALYTAHLKAAGYSIEAGYDH